MDSVKQRCFEFIKSHPNRCILYAYGNDLDLKYSDGEILSFLRTARFGDFFILVCHVETIVPEVFRRETICVLVDSLQWCEVSESMIYNLRSLSNNEKS